LKKRQSMEKKDARPNMMLYPGMVKLEITPRTLKNEWNKARDKLPWG